ncbi:type VI secretion system protein TssA [Hansschlegelia beijingensis]|uniref:type VI secretion system protein TssA n=1 Tax=Hansschlegelia beijingensis TaxID=1133344 RepID=UPI002483E151|nr:type VI secretion system protein TssA [Hansschlegelia beijingensis]
MLASGETEHLSSLLEPILDEAPAGEDLRLDETHDGLYSRLRDARLEARAAERLADNDPDLGDAAPPQWSTVRELALEALATRSKDVEIACWLTESLTRHDGLAGLAAGAGLIAGLVERYWDVGLHPAAEQDDPEGRLLALTGLSGRDRDGSLMQPLRKTELFARADGAPVTLWSFERSMSVAALGAEVGKAQRVPDTVAPFADLEAEARGPGRAALQAVGRDAARAEAAWATMEASIERSVPEAMRPSTGRVRGLLETVRRIATRYAPESPAAPDTPAGAEEAAGGAPAAGAAPAHGREALLDEVLRIAAAFRLSEPSSPVGFTLEEAVRRARMPWPDLLRELMPDAGARSAVLTTAGLSRPDATGTPD